MIMRGAFWSLWSRARLSEAELESVACGRVAAEGWNQPVDTEHLPLVDHGSLRSVGPWNLQWWTMDHASLVGDHVIDRPSFYSWQLISYIGVGGILVLMSSFTGFGLVKI